MSVEEGIVIKGERPTENKNRKKERERKLKEGRIQNYRQEKSREMKDKRGSNQSKGRGAIRRKKKCRKHSNYSISRLFLCDVPP